MLAVGQAKYMLLKDDIFKEYGAFIEKLYVYLDVTYKKHITTPSGKSHYPYTNFSNWKPAEFYDSLIKYFYLQPDADDSILFHCMTDKSSKIPLAEYYICLGAQSCLDKNCKSYGVYYLVAKFSFKHKGRLNTIWSTFGEDLYARSNFTKLYRFRTIEDIRNRFKVYPDPETFKAEMHLS